jgi:hypothetical protein
MDDGIACDKERRRFPRVMIDLPLEYQVLSNLRAHGGMIEDMGEQGFRMRKTTTSWGDISSSIVSNAKGWSGTKWSNDPCLPCPE